MEHGCDNHSAPMASTPVRAGRCATTVVTAKQQSWPRTIRVTAVALSIAAITGLVTATPVASAAVPQKPIWAKGAIALNIRPGEHPAAPQRIVSPDGNILLEVRHSSAGGEDGTFFIHVIRPSGRWQNADLDEGAHELLWAPDSTAFLVNGATSGYAGFFTALYRFGPDGFRKLVVTEAAQRDVVTTFPPCKALNRDETICREITKNPEFNMSGISWVRDASQIVVVAEVPCSSSYGGIMCQVLGHVLSVPEGRIIERLTARDLKARWQGNMAWTMRIPDPPQYESPSKKRK